MLPATIHLCTCKLLLFDPSSSSFPNLWFYLPREKSAYCIERSQNSKNNTSYLPRRIRFVTTTTTWLAFLKIVSISYIWCPFLIRSSSYVLRYNLYTYTLSPYYFIYIVLNHVHIHTTSGVCLVFWKSIFHITNFLLLLAREETLFLTAIQGVFFFIPCKEQSVLLLAVEDISKNPALLLPLWEKYLIPLCYCSPSRRRERSNHFSSCRRGRSTST